MIEIREVTYGRGDGYVLASKMYNQKYHLVSRESDVEPGDIVTADLLIERTNFAIYNCKKIHGSRMILKLVDSSYFGNDRKNIAIWMGHTREFDSIPEQYIESRTPIYSRHCKNLALVQAGYEEEVWALIANNNAEPSS
ncbi:MAG: hypothetical protein WC453_02720 [Patescibacteria group bacterium]